MAARDHLIVALDVDTVAEADAIVQTLGDDVSYYKVGPHLFVRGLIDFTVKLLESGKHIFLDFKSYDIGDTMRGMASQVSRLGIDFMTIGRTASTIVAARDGRENRQLPKILVVTLLTDHDEADMQQEYHTSETVAEFVARRAREAADAGADGVICSPKEVTAVRKAVPKRDFLIVTPGVRLVGETSNDQKRVATPYEAIREGADYLVVGRPIVRARDKSHAARLFLEEIQRALDEGESEDDVPILLRKRAIA